MIIKEIFEKIYIFTGGQITEDVFSSFVANGDLIIGVDSGIEFLLKKNVIPDYFVGDFDSLDSQLFTRIKKEYPEKIKIFPVKKDETDTELALKFAFNFNPKEIIIIGGIGSRIDHVIANINILLQAEIKNIKAVILDTNNRIQLLIPNKILQIEKSSYKYVSLLSFSDKVEGINALGFKYPLKHGEMVLGIPSGVSNELIADKGSISIEDGILLVIESID